MKTCHLIACATLLIHSAFPLDAAVPVIANLTAAQRAGSKLVDITYDVTADTPTVFVSLEISSDGGTTFSIPATAVSGAIGAGVAPSTGKTITWDAGADWPGQYSTQMRFKVTATDVPSGFSWIPAGAFTMGDSLDGMSDAPVRTVTLSAFYMGVMEVTKAEWDLVRTWAVSHGYTDLRAGVGNAANHPVHTVSWWDTIKWCNARSEKEGYTPCYTLSGTVMRTGTTVPTVNWAATGYRLPTEAEWEKGARGGLSGVRYPLGNSITLADANFSSSGAVAVGTYAPNGYGLYDMAGNVWEWCWDWYGSYASGPQTDPRGASSGSKRVNRGGSWSYDAYACRAADRDDSAPVQAYTNLGFRPARLVPSNGSNSLTSDVLIDTRSSVILTITTPQHGTVAGAGDYTPGSTATLTATAEPGYAFTAWSGDASGTANPLSLVMDNSKTVTANFAPDALDDDADGLTNYQEIVVYGTDPTMPDSDGDGVNDLKDDLPLDPAETLDTDGYGVGDKADTDDDGDGYSDVDEITIHHTNPKRADSDGDGLTDPAEIQTHHTDPNIADTDNDGLRDGEEFTTYHTNPLVGDTDGDGFLDGYEVFTGKLPLDPLDKPGLVAEARTAIEFTFPAAIGKTYRIEASMDLATWETVESGIAGNGSQVQRFYSTRGQPKRYFRVELENP